MFLCMAGPHFIHSSLDGHLGGFQFLVTVNSAYVNICAQVLCERMFSFLWSVNPGSEFLGRVVVFNFLRKGSNSCLFGSPFCPWGSEEMLSHHKRSVKTIE